VIDPRKRLLRRHHEASAAQHAGWAAGGYRFPPPPSLPFPDELRGLACGAKTRSGSPCKRTDIYLNGRCKFHGGLSTGPKTPAGRARAVANLAGRTPDLSIDSNAQPTTSADGTP
jgi:hypothetical protein